MTATIATAAVLLVPFLAVVLVGAVAVAIHDAIARSWAGRRATARVVAAGARVRRSGALRGAGGRGGSVALARTDSVPRRPVRRAPAVLVR